MDTFWNTTNSKSVVTRGRALTVLLDAFLQVPGAHVRRQVVGQQPSAASVFPEIVARRQREIDFRQNLRTQTYADRLNTCTPGVNRRPKRAIQVLMYSTAKSFLLWISRAVLGGHGSLTVRALTRLKKKKPSRNADTRASFF